jgi:DNA polymerase III subunit delta'
MSAVRLSELLGLPGPSTFLRSVVAGGRYANAYLFTGPTGVGKGTAALAFARALLCETRNRAQAQGGLFDAPGAGAPAPASTGPGSGPADDACGVCAACRKSAQLTHPDLKFLFPVSGEEKELDDTVAATLEAMREDPAFVFQYDRAASIRLGLTRDLLRELAYRPYEGDRRVVVVRDADRMRADQYSALLKSIEEPGASTVWVLTTARLARLPATIPSRCQRVRFAPLPEETIREFLVRRAGVADADARLLAALSSGSLARALVLREGDPREERDRALALFTTARAGDPAALWKAVQGFMNYGRTGREPLRRMVEFHELWLRDLLRVRYGATRDQLANADREEDVRRLAGLAEPAEVRRRLLVLEEMLRSIEGNVTTELAMFSALSRLSGGGAGEAGWPAHPTARWDY